MLSGNDGHRVTAHDGHTDGKAVLSVIGAKEISVGVTENAAVGSDAVDIEGKSLDPGEIHYDLLPPPRGPKSARLNPP